MIDNIIQKVLTSKYIPVFVFAYAYICYFLSSFYLLAIVLAFLLLSILILAKNVNNAFPIMLYAGFFMKNMYETPLDWTFYGILIACVIITLTTTIIIDIIKKKKEYKKGFLFYPLIALDIAFMLGGILSEYFSFTVLLTVFGFNFLVMELYLTVMNRTENFADFMLYALFIGGIFLTTQLFTYNIILANKGEVHNLNFWEYNIWFTAENINTTSIFMGLGIIGAFKVFENKKYNALCILVILYLFLGIYVSACRTMIAISFILIVGLSIRYLFVIENKKVFLFGIIGGIVLFLCLLWLLGESPITLIQRILKKMESGLSGREKLWPWCFNRFLENPIFGVGFIYNGEPLEETVLSGGVFILAHNSFLQFLCSTGLIGSAFACYFYYKKYRLVFSNPKKNLYAVIALLVIALSGITDQSAITDFFIYTLSILLVGVLDNDRIKA